jgi:hypothetical protein
LQESTTFHFDVKPDSLRPALDRFAQFFISPLIKADALGREVQAVENEFAGVLQVGAARGAPECGWQLAAAAQQLQQQFSSSSGQLRLGLWQLGNLARQWWRMQQRWHQLLMWVC